MSTSVYAIPLRFCDILKLHCKRPDLTLVVYAFEIVDTNDCQYEHKENYHNYYIDNSTGSYTQGLDRNHESLISGYGSQWTK